MIEWANIKSIVTPLGEVKSITCDGEILWKTGYENQVLLSINGDGSIYNNGLGYKNGYRLSSSGEEKAQTNSTTTGFIPATNGDIIRMSGGSMYVTVSGGYSYIVFYDSAFNKIAHGNWYQKGSNYVNNSTTNINKATSYYTVDENGVTTFTLDVSVDYSYIRISAEGDGSSLVVTVNEEIE